MGDNLTRKIISAHLIDGVMKPGHEVGIGIDQTLTQDATGTMVFLEFEAMGIRKVKTEISVSYVDHNTLQTGFENADDHRFLQSAAAKFGVHFSRAGNGICHQVHLERFGVPGKTLLGSDSHTPTCGGLGMLAMGAGGLDVAAAMAGYPYYIKMPEVLNIRLLGRLPAWVSAKDIILKVLLLLTVKGGLGKVIEYSGDGIRYLQVPERATITNMGAELGATSSIFPSDEVTKAFLAAEGRPEVYTEILPDPDATYDDTIDIHLDKLEPLIALPHMPDRVVRVSDVAGRPVDQVFIGSCTSSSYADLMKAAMILKGRSVHPSTSLVVAPGSRQVMLGLASNGALAELVKSGARILECACGPCVGVGQAPPSRGVSLRTSNRNFEGRSGTVDAEVYLASCETAAASAIAGRIVDPRELGQPIRIEQPREFPVDDTMIIPPPAEERQFELIMGPNIKPLPAFPAVPESIEETVLLKLGDNVTTDHITPAGAKILPLRSNIPAIAEHTFERVDPTFTNRARESGGGIIIAGENYGQGSSREHAALAPRYLGIRAVVAKSFARIHMQNLVNFGILPLVFDNVDDYNEISQGDILKLTNIRDQLRHNALEMEDPKKGEVYLLRHVLSPRQLDILSSGGLLAHIRDRKDVSDEEIHRIEATPE